MEQQLTRNSRCPCGSGKRYKACCAKKDWLNDRFWTDLAPGRFPHSLIDSPLSYLVAREPVCVFEDQPIPPGIFVRDLGDEYPWRDIADEVVGKPSTQKLGVQNSKVLKKMSEARETIQVPLNDKEAAAKELVKRLYLELVAPFFKAQLLWYQLPQVLRYVPGGYYRPHADSDTLNRDTGKWQRVNDRHLGLLVYLDDDFTGGELSFPNFDFQIRPRAGLVMAFPADGRYLHGAMPVKSGVRHALVSWSSIKGGESLGRRLPSDAIFVDG